MPFDDREDWEARLQRAIEKITAPQAEKLMRLLGDPPNPDNVPPSFWLSLAEETQTAIQPIVEKVYLAGAQNVLPTVPKILRVDWHLANEPAAAFAERYTFDLVKGINATSQERLRRFVANFFRTEATTNATLSGQITNLFGPARAEAIAITEVTRAATQGGVAIVKQIEADNPKIEMEPTWDTSMDEFVCIQCGPMGLQGIVGKMVNGQPRYKSRNGRTYGAPPDPHVRCRCDQTWKARPKAGR